MAFICSGFVMPSFCLEEMSEQEVMESDIEAEVAGTKGSYINDIEILGANIIKPEYILSKINLKRGDLYDKDLMQQDLMRYHQQDL